MDRVTALGGTSELVRNHRPACRSVIAGLGQLSTGRGMHSTKRPKAASVMTGMPY